jgi:hypothetical protein
MSWVLNDNNNNNNNNKVCMLFNRGTEGRGTNE